MKQVLIGSKLADFGGFWESLAGFWGMGVCKFATTRFSDNFRPQMIFI